MPEPPVAPSEDEDITMAPIEGEDRAAGAGSAQPNSAKPSASLSPAPEPAFAPRTSGRLRRPRISTPPPEPPAARRQSRTSNAHASGSGTGAGADAGSSTSTDLQPAKGRPRLSSKIYDEKHPPLPTSLHQVAHLAEPVPVPKNLCTPVLFPDMHDLDNQPSMEVRGARPNGLLPCPVGGAWTTDVNDLLILHPPREEDPPGWSLYTCRVCGKTYDGKNSRSVARRHLQDKHGVPLAVQSRRSRWDIERDKERQERRAEAAEAEEASGQFVSLKQGQKNRIRQLYKVEKIYSDFLELFGPNGIITPYGFILIAPKFRFPKGRTSPVKKPQYLDGSVGKVIIPEEILTAVAGIREVYYVTDQGTGKTRGMPHVVKPEVMQLPPTIMGTPSGHADTPPPPRGASREGPSGSGPSGSGSPMPRAGGPSGAPNSGQHAVRASAHVPRDPHHHHQRIELSVSPPITQTSSVPVHMSWQATSASGSGSGSASMSASAVASPNGHATPQARAAPVDKERYWRPTPDPKIPTIPDQMPGRYQATALDDVDVAMEGDAIEVDEVLKEGTRTDSRGSQSRSRELSLGRPEEREGGSINGGGSIQEGDVDMVDGKEEKARVLMQVAAVEASA
ncbi:hypothetical protein IAT38_008099 [Cryptococcus sp. DSM 104549]